MRTTEKFCQIEEPLRRSAAYQFWLSHLSDVTRRGCNLFAERGTTHTVYQPNWSRFSRTGVIVSGRTTNKRGHSSCRNCRQGAIDMCGEEQNRAPSKRNVAGRNPLHTMTTFVPKVRYSSSAFSTNAPRCKVTTRYLCARLLPRFVDGRERKP